jgi:hypothetical protein
MNADLPPPPSAPVETGGGAAVAGGPTSDATEGEPAGRSKGGRRSPEAVRASYSPREPLAGPAVLRGIVATMLSLLCFLTVGGAILMLLLWQQQRESGVLQTQVERTWELFDWLVTIERWVAYAVVPVAMAWIVLVTVNIRRATGNRPNPVIAALSLPVGIAGVWYVGRELVAPADDIVGAVATFALQVVFILVPLVALLRLAVAADGRHMPMRVAAVLSAVVVAQIQFLAGLSTVDQTATSDEWARLGAFLIITALTQMLATLAANEGGRAIEEGTQHRFELRSHFGASVLAQAGEL